MPSIKRILALNYLICLVGFIAELIFAYHFRTNENSVFIFMIIWGFLPIFLLLLFLFKTPPVLYFLRLSLVQTTTVVGLGLILKINSIYINPDPRGAIALMRIPIIQVIGTLFIGLIIRFLTKKYLLEEAEENNNEV